MRSGLIYLSLAACLLASCAQPATQAEQPRCADVVWKSGIVHRVCSTKGQVQVVELKAGNPDQSRELYGRSAAAALAKLQNPLPSAQ